jgi:transcriptional regulator GlxA family with amidase domain
MNPRASTEQGPNRPESHGGGARPAGRGRLPRTAPIARASSLAGTRDRQTVAVMLFRNTPMFDNAVPLAVFDTDPRLTTPLYRVLVCAGEPGPLAMTGAVQVSTSFGLAAADTAGTVVVPAWRTPGERPLTTLRRAYREGARVVGMCSGVFVLAAAGLLDGRLATTHWVYAAALAQRHPRVRLNARELFVEDDGVLTSGGVAAGLDLGLHVVRADHGVETANAVARRLVFPPVRRGGQTPYFDQDLPPALSTDPLADVLTWALEHLTEPLDIDTLANRAGLSRRSFDRRFRTTTGTAPLQWLNTQRVRYAQRLLESTDLPVDAIARRSGFGSTVAMRGHFRRLLATSPASYRETYRSLMGAAEGRGKRA